MGQIMVHTGSVLQGKGGAFMRLGGKLRYQQMNGRHFVVGNLRAVEYDTAPECYEHVEQAATTRKGSRDQARIVAAAAARAAIDAAAMAADARGIPIKVGDRVRFACTPTTQLGAAPFWVGRVAEIGGRSVAIDTDDGNTYRRAPGTVELVA
jgi:hypothetical protein